MRHPTRVMTVPRQPIKRSRFSTTLDDDLITQLKILAVQEHKPVNRIVEECLKAYVLAHTGKAR